MSDKILQVYDSSATAENPKRIHDLMIEGLITPIAFEYGKPTELPYEIGIKFMKDGFRVCEQGAAVALKPPPVTDETIRYRIAADEVIAKLSELSDEALRLRVAIKPGGEKLLSSDRGELLDFLLGAAKVEAEATGGELEIEFNEEGDDLGEVDEIVNHEEQPEQEHKEQFGPPSPEPTNELVQEPQEEDQDTVAIESDVEQEEQEDKE